LEHVKGGRRVTHRSWGERGTFVCLNKGAPEGAPIGGSLAKAIGMPEKTIRKVAPYLMLHTAMGYCVPYTPSQAELLSNDWALVDDPDDED
jgi:hypothetical protein